MAYMLDTVGQTHPFATLGIYIWNEDKIISNLPYDILILENQISAGD